MHNPLMQTTHHLHKTILSLAIYISTGARHFVESHFVGTTFGRIRLSVDVTFRGVRHSVEKKIARYDIPSNWSTQLFYNKPLKKSTYLNNAVISQHCLSNDRE